MKKLRIIPGYTMFIFSIISLIPIAMDHLLRNTTLNNNIIVLIVVATVFGIFCILILLFISSRNEVISSVTKTYGFIKIKPNILHNFRDVTKLDVNKLGGNFYSLMSQGMPGKIIIGAHGDTAIVIDSKKVYDYYVLSFSAFYLAPDTILDFSERFLPEETGEIIPDGQVQKAKTV